MRSKDAPGKRIEGAGDPKKNLSGMDRFGITLLILGVLKGRHL